VATGGTLFSCGGWYHRYGKGVNAARAMRGRRAAKAPL
jgi:hypothetical protein